MQQILIILMVINSLYFMGSFYWQPTKMEDVPLTEKNIPVLVVLKELPGSHYRGNDRPSSSSCFSVGPYFSEQTAQTVAGKIRDYGLQVILRQLSGMQTINYLVYIKPLANRSEIERMIEDLSDNNIDEYNVIETGPYRNAIAFGMFKQLDKAKRHTEYIRYLGYNALYTEQTQKQMVYWLDYDEPFGMGVPVQTWSESVDKHVDIQVIPRAC